MRSFRELRTNLALRTALAAAVACPMPASAAVVAKSSEVFVTSLGINTHVSLSTLVGPLSPYFNANTVVGQLQYLGIHHLRDDIRNTSNGTLNDYSILGSAGNSLMLMFAPNHFATPSTALTTLQPVAPYIEALEGSNEIDISPPTYQNYSGAPAATAYQKDLWKARAGNPAFTKAQVVYYTYGNFVINPVTGAVTSGLDSAGNVHAYPANGQPPYKTLASAATIELPNSRTVWMSETNYPTGLPATIQSVPQAVQASYLLDTLFDNAALGFARTYIYELDDEANNLSNKEDCFGLFNYNGSPKPAATAVHNLIQILSTSKTGTMGALAFTLSQAVAVPSNDANTFHLLLQKPGGQYELIVWAEPVLIANPYAGVPNPPPPAPHAVTITFPVKHTTINVYDPLQGTSPINTYTLQNSVTVSTTDHPLIIEITPG